MSIRQRIFVALAIILVGIAIYLVMTGRTQDSQLAEGGATQQQKEEIEDDAGGSIQQKGKKGLDEDQYLLEPPFFRLPTIRVPILKDNKVLGYFQIKLEMEASSLDNFNEAKILLSRLVDGIFSDLYSSLSNLWISDENPKADVLKERVIRVVNKILGKGKIKNVFVRQVVLERLNL